MTYLSFLFQILVVFDQNYKSPHKIYIQTEMLHVTEPSVYVLQIVSKILEELQLFISSIAKKKETRNSYLSELFTFFFGDTLLQKPETRRRSHRIARKQK